MSNIIEKCKQEFLEEYELGFHKEYFSSKENEVLNEIISNGAIYPSCWTHIS